MNRLIINKNAIIRNCEIIAAQKQKHNFRLFVMAKSNLYGFGYGLLEQIAGYIDGIVLPGVRIGQQICSVCDTVVTRFQPEESTDTYCYIISKEDENQRDKSKIYVRVDPFLGLHGISMEELRNLDNLSEYHGLLVYINEFLTDSEMEIMDELFCIANSHDLVINVGGSVMLRYLDRFSGRKMELRLLREILLPKQDQASMCLACRVIKQGPPQAIGFKSDRQIPETGMLGLLSVGYYECKWISEMYKRDIPLTINGRPYRIPCYPCMNTMWIHSEENMLPTGEVRLFSDYQEVMRICEILDIDVDEFYSAFPGDIPRIYE